jgi:hypothetical protein
MNHAYILLNLLDDEIKNSRLSMMSMLSSSYNITWNLVLERKDIEWCYYILCKNPNITIDIIKSSNLIKTCSEIGSNPSITWETTRSNSDINWSYMFMSINPNITWEIVKSNPDKQWNYAYLSSNPNITWEIVQSNPTVKWNYVLLSANPNITLDIVSNNNSHNWDYKLLNINPNMTLEFVMSNITDSKSIMHTYGNPSFTVEQLGIDSKYIIGNPNITWKHIYYNKKVNINYRWTTNKLIRHNCSQKIQHLFRRWRSKMMIELSTQLLFQTYIGDCLPFEIILNICHLYNV